VSSQTGKKLKFIQFNSRDFLYSAKAYER